MALAGSSLFGATMSGGVFGTVFTIQTDGSDYSIVHSFPVAADGTHPRSSVVVDSAGALYGTTQTGGSSNSDGVVFKLTGIVVDTAPPAINCIAPPIAGWVRTNVTVNCTASDTGSGLANAADASFTLATSVPSNTETSTASTNFRTIATPQAIAQTPDLSVRT